ncbi:hypothetical protein F2Q70_00011714 [Brassica cretica]|uniref:Uncharacterized protein n=1 Tax=Brassica cretica TaxID=69181 RepID=A0A3N6RIM8_BRACR|nr:hypothetical protein F2Q70_00011714 [Brassica cretica]KAF3548324.1 hypothetical protein DY000_02007146 [Brassica cretica]
MNQVLPPYGSQVPLSGLRTGTIVKEQERSLLRGAIGTASLSASGTFPQDGMGDEKGLVKGRRGLA